MTNIHEDYCANLLFTFETETYRVKREKIVTVKILNGYERFIIIKEEPLIC